MDIMIEIIIEILFEGAMEAVENKWIPKVIRIILAVLLLAFYFGLVGLFFYWGVRERSRLCIVVGMFLLFLVTILGMKIYRGIKKR